MAVILPVAGAWPLSPPEGGVEPGLDVLDSRVRQLVEAQHYLCGYHLMSHCACFYQGRNTPIPVTPGHLETAAAALTPVAEQVLVPRYGALGEQLLFIVDSDGGLELQATCVEDGSASPVVAAGAGVNAGLTSWAFVASRGEMVTTIRIYLRALGTWAAIYALSLRDADLTAATLP